jgi:hypothetical protein
MGDFPDDAPQKIEIVGLRGFEIKQCLANTVGEDVKREVVGFIFVHLTVINCKTLEYQIIWVNKVESG